MAEAMLYGNLLESLKLWRQTEEAVEMEKKVRKKETGNEYTKKVPRGDKTDTFKACLVEFEINSSRNTMQENRKPTCAQGW